MTKHWIVRAKFLVREASANRLVQFLIIGALIFWRAAPPERENRLFFSRLELAALYAAQAKKKGAALLSEEEKKEVEIRAVEDELLYREAIRMGFDKHDHIVKQRMVQKVLALAEYMEGEPKPTTDEEAHAYYQAHREEFKKPKELSFQHVFLAKGHESRAERVRRQVETFTSLASEPPFGDSFPISRAVGLTGIDRIGSDYGQAFASALEAQRPGQWSGPIESRYGLHFVRVNSTSEAGYRSFEAALDDAKFACAMDKRNRATRGFIEKVRANYEVVVEGNADVQLTSLGSAKRESSSMFERGGLND